MCDRRDHPFALRAPSGDFTVPGTLVLRHDGFVDWKSAFGEWESIVPDPVRGPRALASDFATVYGPFSIAEGEAFHPSFVYAVVHALGSRSTRNDAATNRAAVHAAMGWCYEVDRRITRALFSAGHGRPLCREDPNTTAIWAEPLGLPERSPLNSAGIGTLCLNEVSETVLTTWRVRVDEIVAFRGMATNPMEFEFSVGNRPREPIAARLSELYDWSRRKNYLLACEFVSEFDFPFMSPPLTCPYVDAWTSNFAPNVGHLPDIDDFEDDGSDLDPFGDPEFQPDDDLVSVDTDDTDASDFCRYIAPPVGPNGPDPRFFLAAVDLCGDATLWIRRSDGYAYLDPFSDGVDTGMVDYLMTRPRVVEHAQETALRRGVRVSDLRDRGLAPSGRSIATFVSPLMVAVLADYIGSRFRSHCSMFLLCLFNHSLYKQGGAEAVLRDIDARRGV